MTMSFTASFQDEGEWIVATCLENGVASQGHTIEEALSNLKEALELYFEDEPKPPKYPQVYVTSFEVAV
jgi:predicted RNase H-like HicB family nuclease